MRRSLNNRPLRSVLANRKMFQGGGIVASGGGPRPMANMQPNGILASSPNLINSVVSDAINPQGGNTLSMAEGGIAKFREGGYKYDPVPFSTRYPGQHGTWPEDLYPAMGAKLRKAFSERAADSRGIVLGEAPRAISSDDQTMPSQAERDAILAQTPGGGIIQAAEEAGPPLPRSDSNIPELLSEQLLAEGEIEPAVATEEAAQPPDQRTIMQQDPEYRVAVDQAVDGIKVAIAAGPDAHQAAVAELTQSDNSETFKQEVLERTGFEAGPDKVTEEDDFSPAPDAPGRPDEDGVAVEATYTKDLVPLTNWLKTNAVTSADEIPASILSQSVDGIIDKAIAGIEGKTFDKEAFKAEIESLIPTVEDDPETEGLLIAMLGASIMSGTSQHWAVNVGKGVEKALPSLINFKNKKKEAERSRQMTVAKLTIEEGLKRDGDIRKAVGALEQSRTASQLSEAQKLLTPKDWWVSESITIPAELIGGKKGDPDVFLPQGSTLNLNQLSQTKLASLGVKALPFERGSWKLSDFISNKELMTTAEHVKAMNAYGDRVQAEVFGEFRKTGGKKINYITPTPGALTHGGRTHNMINTSDLQAFMSEYYAVKQPTIDLRNDVREILSLVLDDPSKFVGTGLLLDQATDVVSGMFGRDSGIVKELESWGATKSLGAAEQARVRSIIVLAKIAPLLLDESGKTISDADRKMIAGTLGLTMIPNDEKDPSKGFQVQLNASIFRNPQAIALAIQQTEQALNRRLNAVNGEARTHLATFGVPASAEEMLELERLQDEQLKGTGQSAEWATETLDFDLVGG